MTAADAIQTAHAFPQAVIVPVHFEGWAHFSEGREDILRGFTEAGLSDRLRLLEPGESAILSTLAAGAPGG